MVYLVLLISGGLAYYLIKLAFKIDKYEFENRSAGGVIGFQDYKAAFWHKRKKAVVHIFGILSIFVAVGCVAVIFY